MSNPYLLPNPSVVSFSGGRTSAYMLRKILDAFGGTLPDWVKVTFENTGKEREETLEFVDRCSREWNVPIVWLEYCRGSKGEHNFRVVDFATASRNGEPLESIISYFRDYRTANGEPPILPNPVQRFCTAEGKVRCGQRYVKTLGWTEYHDAIGLRADEPKRVAKMMRKTRVVEESTLFGVFKETIRGATHAKGVMPILPLNDAGVTVDDIYDFWRSQPFDLQLRSDEGNCDLCFLKSAPKILRLIRERPESADWWIAKEAETGATFRKDRPTYAEMKRIAIGVIDGPGWLWADSANGSCGEMDECRCTD